MKRFIFLSLILIAIAFVAPAVSGSNSPPPYQLTVSLGQQQLDQVATINTMVEQKVNFTIQDISYAYQARSVMPEINLLVSLPLPHVLYSNLLAYNLTTSLQNTGALSSSMRLSARNAVMPSNSCSTNIYTPNAVLTTFYCSDSFYNPNALIRML